MKRIILFSLVLASQLSLARDYEDFDKRASGKTGYVNSKGEAFEYIEGVGHRKIDFDKVREEQIVKDIQDLKKLLTDLTEPKTRGKAKVIVDEARTTAQKAIADLEFEQSELKKKSQSTSK